MVEVRRARRCKTRFCLSARHPPARPPSPPAQVTLALTPQFCLPPGTLVNRAHVIVDARRAATRALEALGELRGGRDPVAGDLGVVKLGHAWEATHVRAFSGVAELARTLVALSTQPGCENSVLLVQDFVPNDLEMRVYVVRGRQAPPHVTARNGT